MWVTRRKYKRQSPGAAVFSRVRERRLDVLVFAGAQTESSDRSAVNGVGIEWVGLDVTVFAAGLTFDGREALPAIARAIERSVGHINCVGIFRVHGDVGKIPAASPDPRFAVGPPPVRPGVVGAVEPAFPGVHDQINPLRV